MSYIVGVDAGSHSVKIAVFRSGIKGYEAERYYIQNVREKDIWKVEEYLPSLVHKVLQDMKTTEAVISVGLPTVMVTTKLLRFPFSKMAKIEKAIPFELQGLLPFEMNEVVNEYQILEKERKGARVLCLITKKERLKTLIQAFESRGIFLKQIQYLPIALTSLSIAEKVDEAKDMAIANIGYERVELSVYGSKGIRWTGYTATGLKSLMEETVKRFELPLEKVEDIVLHSEKDRRTPETGEVELEIEGLESTIDEGIAGIVTGLKNLLMRFEIDVEGDSDIQMVTLCGGGARLRGVREKIEEETGIKTDVVDLQRFSIPGRGVPHPVFAGSIALCLSRLEKRRDLKFNLMKEELSSRRAEGIPSLFKYALALIFIAFIGGTVLFITRYSAFSREYREIFEGIIDSVKGSFPELPPSTIDSPEKALAVMMQFYSEAEKKSDLFNLRTEKTLTPLDILKELSSRIPKEVKLDVSEFSVTEEVVKIKGETDSFENVEKIESAIKSFERFKEVEKSDVGIGVDGTSKKFTFSIYLKERKKEKKVR